ncbi:MAG: carboxylesterase, partial [Proteobacteria bacterium]|nr:carboxylesterase [Pseudomonadota bacterium]
APVRPVAVNNGLLMRAWYDIAGFDLSQRQDAAGVRASMAEVERLIARENERGVPADKLVLAGFSQGGAIALAATLQHAVPLAGTIALSTYLPLSDIMAAERRPANAGVPIFMAHGSFDPVVPMKLGETSCRLLRGFGHPVDWHSYPMAHQVCPQGIHDLADWLGERVFALP